MKKIAKNTSEPVTERFVETASSLGKGRKENMSIILRNLTAMFGSLSRMKEDSDKRRYSSVSSIGIIIKNIFY